MTVMSVVLPMIMEFEKQYKRSNPEKLKTRGWRIISVSSTVIGVIVLILALFIEFGGFSQHPSLFSEILLTIFTISLLVFSKVGIFLWAFVILPILNNLPSLIAGHYLERWWHNRDKKHIPENAIVGSKAKKKPSERIGRKVLPSEMAHAEKGSVTRTRQPKDE